MVTSRWIGRKKGCSLALSRRISLELVHASAFQIWIYPMILEVDLQVNEQENYCSCLVVLFWMIVLQVVECESDKESSRVDVLSCSRAMVAFHGPRRFCALSHSQLISSSLTATNLRFQAVYYVCEFCNH